MKDVIRIAEEVRIHADDDLPGFVERKLPWQLGKAFPVFVVQP